LVLPLVLVALVAERAREDEAAEPTATHPAPAEQEAQEAVLLVTLVAVVLVALVAERAREDQAAHAAAAQAATPDQHAHEALVVFLIAALVWAASGLKLVQQSFPNHDVLLMSAYLSRSQTVPNVPWPTRAKL